jgi:hypothetical protein
MDLVRRYATRSEAELVYEPRRKHAPLVLRRRVEYFGFELERESESVEVFPPELADRARRVLADALARGEARHSALKRHLAAIEEVREVYRRSGGQTARLGLAELTAQYERALADVGSMEEFRAAPLRLDLDRLVSREERDRWLALPDHVVVRDREVEIDYDVEERDGEKVGIARLRLPEKLARTIDEAELPEFDRPLRFVVLRGQRGAVRAATLGELQELLDRPWSPGEGSDAPRRGDDAYMSRDERRVRELAAERSERPRGRRKSSQRDRQRAGRPGEGRGGGGGGSDRRPGGRGPKRGRRRR